uniref:RRM domain-containing protein n=1 Tax=Trichuris muris TaxID=70415 RepID=A0A5S6Q0L1_TRIMR
MEILENENGMSSRLRLGPLFFPTDLSPVPDIAMELALAAPSVAIILKSAENGEKSGFIVASFASAETANHCYKVVEAMIASSDRHWKLEQMSVNDTIDGDASRNVVKEFQPNSADSDGEQLMNNHVLVGGLLPAVDEQTVSDIFGASDVLSVKFSQESGQMLKSAIVQFKTKEAAEAAIASYEGYEIDDGVTKTHISMQLFQGNVAGENVSECPSNTGANDEDRTDKPSNGHVDLGFEKLEQTPEELCAFIRELMIAERTNWAEVAGEEDLWLILDKVVELVGWQPEETLKEAMLTTLQTALAECEYEWLAEHLNMLLRKWTKETDNPDKSKVRKRLLLANADGRNVPGPDHVPPLYTKSRKRNKRSVALMGIGSVLSKMKSQSEQPADTSVNVQNERAKKRTNDRSSAKKRKRDQSSSESGEASSTPPSSGSEGDEEQEQEKEEEYHTGKMRRHRANSDSSRSKSSASRSAIRRSKKIDPEWMQSVLEQVIPHMFRLMPKLIQWMNNQNANGNNSSAPPDPQFRQEMGNMGQSFSNPGMMPLVMNNYGYRAPSIPVGPTYPPMVANLSVPPPVNVSQSLYGVNSSAYSYSGTAMRLPFTSAPPPPPPNRQY